jgi:hypothetical protein
MAEQKEFTNAELHDIILKQGEKIDILTKLVGNSNIIKDAVKKEKPKLPEEPVEHQGKKYQALVPAFKLQGQSYTTEQANIVPELLAKVLAVEGQKIYKELV